MTKDPIALAPTISFQSVTKCDVVLDTLRHAEWHDHIPGS